MDRGSLEKMLSQAKNEISQIERQLAELSARRDLLWRFVATSKELLQHEDGKAMRHDLASAESILHSPTTGTLIAPNASCVSLPFSRLWEGIKLVMDVAKRPVSVPEIVDLLDNHKIIVPGEHPRETVRSAISRKDDVFEKIDRGFYVLKNWPEAIKQLRRDETISTEVA